MASAISSSSSSSISVVESSIVTDSTNTCEEPSKRSTTIELPPFVPLTYEDLRLLAENIVELMEANGALKLLKLMREYSSLKTDEQTREKKQQLLDLYSETFRSAGLSVPGGRIRDILEVPNLPPKPVAFGTVLMQPGGEEQPQEKQTELTQVNEEEEEDEERDDKEQRASKRRCTETGEEKEEGEEEEEEKKETEEKVNEDKEEEEDDDEEEEEESDEEDDEEDDEDEDEDDVPAAVKAIV